MVPHPERVLFFECLFVYGLLFEIPQKLRNVDNVVCASTSGGDYEVVHDGHPQAGDAFGRV